MNLTAWIIFAVLMGGIIFLNIKFFRGTKKSKENQKDFTGITVKKEPWQKRNIVNGFIYYTLPWLFAWGVITILTLKLVATLFA